MNDNSTSKNEDKNLLQNMEEDSKTSGEVNSNYKVENNDSTSKNEDKNLLQNIEEDSKTSGEVNSNDKVEKNDSISKNENYKEASPSSFQ